MAHQPKLTDKDAWKRIGNSALFFAGWTTSLLWLGNQWLSAWVLFAGLLAVGLSAQLFMWWKKDYVSWRDDPDPEPDPNAARKPFQYGPRDMGPANPPPWPHIVMMLMALAVCFTAGGIGASNHEFIYGLYVRGPAAFICVTGLMFALTFVGDGFDKARAEENRRNGED